VRTEDATVLATAEAVEEVAPAETTEEVVEEGIFHTYYSLIF
jgi:hypothetical protein